MTPQQRENCEKLLKFLEQAGDEACDMRDWVQREADGPVPPPEQRDGHTCGTAACLAGWGALLFAPTIDILGAGIDSLAAERGRMLVPTAWADQHELGTYWMPEVGVDYTVVAIADVGLVVLGPELADYFYSCDRAREFGNYRRWMILTVKHVLGIATPEEEAEWLKEGRDADHS